MPDARGQILHDALGIVTGPRQETYGHPLDNHSCEAAMWTAYLRRRGLLRDGARLTERDVCWLMVYLKGSRDANYQQRENPLDAIGYLENAEECRVELERRAASEANGH